MVLWMPPVSPVHGLDRTGNYGICGLDIGADRFLGGGTPRLARSAPAPAPLWPRSPPPGPVRGARGPLGRPGAMPEHPRRRPGRPPGLPRGPGYGYSMRIESPIGRPLRDVLPDPGAPQEPPGD